MTAPAIRHGLCLGAVLLAALALPPVAHGQSDPGGPRPPDPQRSIVVPPGAPPDAGAGAKSDTPEMSPALHGIWTGTGLQDGSTWTIRLTLGGARPVIEYPSLSCGGHWEAIPSAKAGTFRFVERITYGLDECVPDGYVTLTVAEPGLRYEWSTTENGPIEARGTLNR